MLVHKDLTDSIISAAIEVHRAIGAGLLESAYEACFCHELQIRNIPHVRQLQLPLEYKGIELDCGYRIDVLVSDTVIVEIKAVEKLLDIHDAQLLTYMRLMRKPVGLLMNFNSAVLKDGIRRRVL